MEEARIDKKRKQNQQQKQRNNRKKKTRTIKILLGLVQMPAPLMCQNKLD